jgi:MFS transporter, DHA2 family, multidrug resistance protein
MEAAMNAQVATVPLPAATSANPWLIAVVVALAVFMEVLDTTIANVALPHIAGSLGVSQDEASWVVTTYLVSNAIIVTATSFLPKRFGRKPYFLTSLGLFTLSSVLCGLAWSLPSLLLFRVLQGLGGGGMVPVAQSILADAFPPQKRGQAFALFGVAVVVAPVVGPVLGGWLTDNYSWHWNFLVNGPVGIVVMALVSMLVKEGGPAEKVRFDWIGFLLVASFLGSLELVLDRGLVEDWFASNFIIAFTAICAVAFLALIPWEATRPNPTVDVRMVATRQFGSALLVMVATGAILFSTTQFMPQLVQEDFGYTATWAGFVLSPGGLVTMVMMFAVGQLSSRVQPKYLIATGAIIIAISMYNMTNITSDLSFWFFAKSRILLGLGLPLVFIPIMAASYDGIAPSKIDQASALMNAARNTGGSIGVALASNVLAHREQFHQSRLAENAIPSSISYQDTLQHLTHYFVSQGSPLLQAQQQAIQWIGQQVQTQASLLAYIDVFWTLMVVSLAAVPIALLLRQIKLGGPAPAGH